MTHRLTRESARAARACYSDERIAELIPPEGISVREVVQLPIPDSDRFWALSHACGATQHQLARFCLTTAHELLERERSAGRTPDPRSVAALEAVERWLLGDVSVAEVRLAASSAYSAYAAYASASSAASSAASASANASASASAYYSAYASADAASYASYADRIVARIAARIAARADDAANAANASWLRSCELLAQILETQ